MVLDENSSYGNCTDPYTDQVGDIPGARARFSVSPLLGQLHSLLGSMEFQVELLAEPTETRDVPSPYVKGRAPIHGIAAVHKNLLV